MLLCPSAMLWYQMKNISFSTQGFILTHLPLTTYVIHTQTCSRRMRGYCTVVFSVRATLYCYWKKVTMAMIFSRQVKVWTGTLLKHHLFPVGNGCGIPVNSIQFRQGCVGKNLSSRRHVQHSRKKKIPLHDLKYRILHTVRTQLKYHCA